MDLKTQASWRAAVTVYRHPRIIAMLFLGFSAGLPLLLVFGTLSFWLRKEGIDRSTIGHISWVALLYGLKFLWAPIVDRLRLPLLGSWLGQRRSWMLLAQLGVILGLLAMASHDPLNQLAGLVLAALLVAFSSATQDITIDAWRIEAVPVDLQGAMAGTYQLGYRLGMLLAGGGAFSLAHFYSWSEAYTWMAAAMLVGIATTLLVAEPERLIDRETWKQEQRVVDFLAESAHWPPLARKIGAFLLGAVVGPFVDFFRRNGKFALLILLFIGLFRISDITMGVMTSPLYVDLGYTALEVGLVTKTIGPLVTIVGALLGGVLVMRFGVMPILLFGACLVVITNLLFAWMATQPAQVILLMLVVGSDNLAGGMAGSAFIAYLSGLTNKAYTATQYALFSSLMLLPAKFLGGFSGDIVDAQGYVFFFSYAAAIGIPAILLVLYLRRRVNVDDMKEAQAR